MGNERGIPLLAAGGMCVPLRAISRYFLVNSGHRSVSNSAQTRVNPEIERGWSQGFRALETEASVSRNAAGEYFRVTDLRRFRMRGDEVSICTSLHRLRIRGTAPLANLWKHNVTTSSNICTFRIELHDRCFCLSRRRDIALSPPGR